MRFLITGLKIVSVLLVVIALVIVLTNAVTILTTRDKILSASAVQDHDAECIVVLGASVQPDGTPSKILQDRLDTAIGLYKAGVAPKIIMSGDNSTASYNEVAAMRRYAVAQGVPSEDIFSDHAGVSTYDSVYRVQAIFGVKRMVVVTQTYHLYRALYAARTLGVDAVGVASDLRAYQDQTYYDIREVFARTKDFFQVLVKAKPDVMSEPVSLDQSGDVTNW